MSSFLKKIIPKVIEKNLSMNEAKNIFEEIISGNATESQIGAILIAMKIRKESILEITAGVEILKKYCIKVNLPFEAIDIVGTGGDGKGTLNISTASSLVVAGCGMPVAKHGNRNLSSQSGSADVLEILGIPLNLEPKKISESILKSGIGFMMAPNHHPAMKNVMPARKSIGVRTIFNILGPLANPANVKYQLTGCYDEKLLNPMIHTLKNLNTKGAWLVYGTDGTDEISISGATKVIELKNGFFKEFMLKPEDFGFPLSPLSEIKGKDPQYNAQQIRSLLNGDLSSYRNSVIMNSSSALYISGKAKTLHEGIEMAKNSIDSGKALNSLKIASSF